VELPTASAMTSNPDPAVGDECWKTGLYMAVRGGRQKPGPVGSQKPAEGGDGHVEGPPAVRDPPHDIIGASLL
jgi:hypothetical protein